MVSIRSSYQQILSTLQDPHNVEASTIEAIRAGDLETLKLLFPFLSLEKGYDLITTWVDTETLSVFEAWEKYLGPKDGAQYDSQYERIVNQLLDKRRYDFIIKLIVKLNGKYFRYLSHQLAVRSNLGWEIRAEEGEANTEGKIFWDYFATQKEYRDDLVYNTYMYGQINYVKYIFILVSEPINIWWDELIASGRSEVIIYLIKDRGYEIPIDFWTNRCFSLEKLPTILILVKNNLSIDSPLFLFPEDSAEKYLPEIIELAKYGIELDTEKYQDHRNYIEVFNDDDRRSLYYHKYPYLDYPADVDYADYYVDYADYYAEVRECISAIIIANITAIVLEYL